jgi:hypothetical protein
MTAETRKRAKYKTTEKVISGHVDADLHPQRNMWQQDHNPYASSSTYYPHQQPQEQLQFYAQPQEYYAAARTSLDSQVQGAIQQPAFGGNIQGQGGWWTAFGTGGVEGEPPLLEGESACSFEYMRF